MIVITLALRETNSFAAEHHCHALLVPGTTQPLMRGELSAGTAEILGGGR
jgi:hypothetical protein